MSVYGDLSKPQREFMQRLFVPVHRAASIETALIVRSSKRLRDNLLAKGFIEVAYVDGYVWRHSLTPVGLELIRSLDYRHSRPRATRFNQIT